MENLAEEVVEKVKEDMGEEKPVAPVPAAEGEKALSVKEKADITLEFKKLLKQKIEKGPKVDGRLDLAKVGEEFALESKGKLYGANQGISELFTAAEPPEFIKNARSTGGSSPIQQIFASEEGVMSKATRIMIDGREDWLLYRVLEIVPAKPLSFEEAKEKVTEALKNEKAVDALEAALKADAEKIAAEMNLNSESGDKKSFKAAADKLGIKYARHYKFIGQPKQEELVGGTFYGYADLIQATAPGAFSEPQIRGEKGYLVYVASKELKEDDTAASKKAAISRELVAGIKNMRFENGAIVQPSPGYSDELFGSWLDRAFEEASPERKGAASGR